LDLEWPTWLPVEGRDAVREAALEFSIAQIGPLPDHDMLMRRALKTCARAVERAVDDYADDEHYDWFVENADDAAEEDLKKVIEKISNNLALALAL
jgi:hypothetical protein